MASSIQNPKSKIPNRRGFSLTEVLIAVAILTIGLVMVGASFPVGVAMVTNVAERTTAAVVADEAFAKMKMWGILSPSDPLDPNWTGMGATNWVWYDWVRPTSLSENRLNEECRYPSEQPTGWDGRVYYWAALCKRQQDAAGNYTGQVRVVIFVSRTAGASAMFPRYFTDDPVADMNSCPRPILIYNERTGNYRYDSPGGDSLVLTKPLGPGRTVTILSTAKQKIYFNPGCQVLDDDTGELYRVMERREMPPPITIEFDRDYAEKADGTQQRKVWVMPSAIGSSRNPCIAVYEKIIKF